MNFHLKDLVNSTRGKYVFSILLGLGLATLFRKACNNKNCLVFKAPSFSDIKGKIFAHNDKCYQYTEKTASCPKDEDKTDNVVLEIGQ